MGEEWDLKAVLRIESPSNNSFEIPIINASAPLKEVIQDKIIPVGTPEKHIYFYCHHGGTIYLYNDDSESNELALVFASALPETVPIETFLTPIDYMSPIISSDQTTTIRFRGWYEQDTAGGFLIRMQLRIYHVDSEANETLLKYINQQLSTTPANYTSIMTIDQNWVAGDRLKVQADAFFRRLF